MPAFGCDDSAAPTALSASLSRSCSMSRTSAPISCELSSCGVAAAAGRPPWQCLNFLPLPQKQGSLRPGLSAMSFAIAARRIAERSNEGREPRLEVLPLLEPLTVDGLTNLLRARRAHAAHGLVKLDALRLELEAAEIENAAHVCFEIVHDVLTLQAQHPSRQHLVPMPHQFQVGPVVARDVINAVGELLPLGKQLFQVAEATCDRLAPRVDDPGVRQYQADQSEVPEVVRHLVDEKRFAGAVQPRAVQVALAQLPDLLGSQLREDAWVARVAGIRVTATKGGHDLLDVGQLVRAFDPGVRG